MNKKLTVYQKPTCSKCRTTLRLLKEHGVEFESINYYEVPFRETDLARIVKKAPANRPRDPAKGRTSGEAVGHR